MRIIADTHTHTLASTHAYGTVLEMAQGAAENGFSYLGMTDHAPGMADSPHEWHFVNLGQLPPTMHGVRVLRGAEANVMDYDGNVDMSDELLARMEWVICSFHPEAIAPKGPQDVTKAIEGFLQNPYLDVFGHPDPDQYAFDYEYIIPKFKDSGKYIEANASSLTFREGAAKNMHTIAELCKKHQVEIIVNSDAHSPYRIGVVEEAYKILRDVDFPEELIVNADLKRFQKALANRHVPIID